MMRRGLMQVKNKCDKIDTRNWEELAVSELYTGQSGFS